jgi:uncharacterized iron-regulated membrane protein
MIWRWHFYAGLLSIPICVVLGITGAIYLFKPYVEPWLYSSMQTVPVGNTVLRAEDQIRAATSEFPDARATAIRFGVVAEDATEVSMRTENGRTLFVYVNPYTGTVTGSLVRDEMLMQQVRNLHGELMMGWFGSAFVELTSCWVIVLVITGLYLWWPRPAFHWKGTFVPRLRQGRRVFWRDLHTVAGMYTSAIVLVLLVTGLPWTNVWGGMFKRVQVATGQNRPEAAERRVSFKSMEPAGNQPLSLTEAISLAESRQMASGYTVLLPRGPRGVYGFTRRAIDLEETKAVYVDQYSGDVVSQATWDDHPATAKAVAMGIRLHQGELFGIPNLILMLIGALATVWMSITGFIMWWQRRPAGKLGVPKLPRNSHTPRNITAIIITFGLMFPLMGASLIVVFLMDRYLLPKFPRTSRVLGLRNAS